MAQKEAERFRREILAMADKKDRWQRDVEMWLRLFCHFVERSVSSKTVLHRGVSRSGARSSTRCRWAFLFLQKLRLNQSDIRNQVCNTFSNTLV